jgi:hypothetical protein
MKRHPRHTSAANLERLLDGYLVDGSPVSRVLSAARAPGTASEVAGLGAARSAFMHASRLPARTDLDIRAAATRTAAGRLFILKVLAAVSGTTLVGGAAYAAADAGLLGSTWHRPPAQHSNAPSDSDSGFIVAPGDGRATASRAISTRPKATPSRAVRGPGSHASASSHAGERPAPSATGSTHRPSTTPTQPGGAAATTPAARTHAGATPSVPITPPTRR